MGEFVHRATQGTVAKYFSKLGYCMALFSIAQHSEAAIPAIEYHQSVYCGDQGSWSESRFIERRLNRAVPVIENNLISETLNNPQAFQGVGADVQELNRELDRKRYYDQVAQEDEKTVIAKGKDALKILIRKWISFQVKDGLKKAEKHSEPVRTFNQVQRAVDRVTGGESTSIQTESGVEFGSMADIPKLEASLWMKSGFVDSSIDLDFRGNLLNLSTQKELANNSDRLRLNLHKSLESFGLESSMTYVPEPAILGTTVRKQLSTQWTAVWGTSKEFKSNTQLAQVVQLEYKISF